jgi:Domain of unknown function (DUF202)
VLRRCCVADCLAPLPRSRKIPLRIEPKTYFALERTYLSWMHMAVMMGGITSALVRDILRSHCVANPLLSGAQQWGAHVQWVDVRCISALWQGYTSLLVSMVLATGWVNAVQHVE